MTTAGSDEIQKNGKQKQTGMPAQAGARAAQARRRAGCIVGPLDGVPVAVKDLADVADWPMGGRSMALAGREPAESDATVVRRLRGGYGDPRQDADGRVRLRRMGVSISASSRTRGTWSATAPRRPVERIGGRRGGGSRHRHHRQRHRRLGPQVEAVDRSSSLMARFTRAGNYLAWCGLTVPIGSDAAGLPLSLQINGPSCRESRLLRVGAAPLELTGHQRKRPQPAPLD